MTPEGSLDFKILLAPESLSSCSLFKSVKTVMKILLIQIVARSLIGLACVYFYLNGLLQQILCLFCVKAFLYHYLGAVQNVESAPVFPLEAPGRGAQYPASAA